MTHLWQRQQCPTKLTKISRGPASKRLFQNLVQLDEIPIRIKEVAASDADIGPTIAPWICHSAWFGVESADATRAFYEEYLAVMDLTSEFYLQTVEEVLQKHALPLGKLMHAGERNDISGVDQTKTVHELTPNLTKAKKDHYEQKGVGHCGIFNGRNGASKFHR